MCGFARLGHMGWGGAGADVGRETEQPGDMSPDAVLGPQPACLPVKKSRVCVLAPCASVCQEGFILIFSVTLPPAFRALPSPFPLE